jgi:hypothetical protein
MLRSSQNNVVTIANRSLMIALIAAAIACLTCAPLLAQVTSGTIFGAVKDSTGAMIQDATVTIANPANGITRTVVSGGDGSFVAPSLYPGTYNITVEAKGFKKLESSGFVLSAADKLNAGDLVLTVGAATQEVNVTADVGQIQLQSNSGERSDLISSKQLNDVAMNGRNALDYLKLVPGVSGTFDGHRSGTGGIASYNINGTRANQHEFTIDGASNVDTGDNGGTHVTLNTDAIEEVKILTSNYQAEFGKAAGGQVAITTKGGSNQFHGNGRFFHRNEGLNANEYFRIQDQLSNGLPNTPGLYRYNYVGYQIGGPIKKDKLFFFWSQEFYRQLVPGGTTHFYTPTDLERTGDFTQSTDGGGRPIVVSGPNIVDNKIVTIGMTDAQLKVFQNVQKILNLYPEPNASGIDQSGYYNYSNTFSSLAPRREDILRVDYQLNDKNRLYGRWIHNSEHDTSPFTPFPGPFGIFACSSAIQFVGGCTQNHPGWNFSANLVSTITPTVLNEFSIGPSHTLSLAESVNGNVSLGKNGIDMPLLFPVTKDQSIPDLHFNDRPGTNFAGSYLGGTPWHQANTTINVNDNLSWVRHNHTLKAGIFYQRSRKDQIAWENINGEAYFSVGPTSGGTCPVGIDCMLGDPLASALLGDFQSFDQSSARLLGKFRYNQLEFYLQDTWKVSSRLTLDYGMRFAWIPPQYDANNHIALFNPSAYKQADAVTINPSTGNIIAADGGNLLNGIQYTSNGTLPAGGWDSRGIMPEGRFGFAYDLYGSHKTVLRGGFGMMHDRVQGNLIFDPTFRNPALVQKPSVGSNNIANLPGLSTSSAEIPTQGDGAVVGAARDGKVPTVYSFSLGVQHELGRGTTLDLAYVGTLSRHLVTSRNINAIPYGTAFTRAAQDPANYASYCSAPDPGNLCVDGLPNVEPNLPQIYVDAGLSFSGINAYGRQSYVNSPLVPYKGFGQIPYLQFDGTSNYNSLQVSLQRRFSKGLTFGVAYTWSKSLTTANSDEDSQNPVNALLDYRAASWDRTHVFAANYVYDLPGITKHLGGPKWLSYLTDNYQLSGVTNFMTGTPIDTGNNFSFESGALDGSNMWGAIPYYYAFDQSKNPVLPSVGLPIRGSRDTLRNGGLQNWDMSLFKNIPFGERYSIQLRLEAFNAFNHPNFDSKNYSINVNDFPFQWQPSDPIVLSKPANYGQYTSTHNPGVGSPRVLQLGAKVYF